MSVRKTRVEEGGGKKRESERELLSERDAQRNKNNGKRQHAREQSNSSSYGTSSVFFTLSFLSGSISLLSHYYIFALFRSFFISIHFFSSFSFLVPPRSFSCSCFLVYSLFFFTVLCHPAAGLRCRGAMVVQSRWREIAQTRTIGTVAPNPDSTTAQGEQKRASVCERKRKKVYGNKERAKESEDVVMRKK